MVRLIQPVDVIISQIDKIKTPFSDGVSGRREPRNRIIRRASITLQAQIVHGNTEQKSMWSQMFVNEEVSGYLVLLFKDLDKLAFPLLRGDKITKLGQLNVEYYIVHSKGDPAAHFSSIDGFSLVRMFFGDREPTGNQNSGS